MCEIARGVLCPAALTHYWDHFHLTSCSLDKLTFWLQPKHQQNKRICGFFWGNVDSMSEGEVRWVSWCLESGAAEAILPAIPVRAQWNTVCSSVIHYTYLITCTIRKWILRDQFFSLTTCQVSSRNETGKQAHESTPTNHKHANAHQYSMPRYPMAQDLNKRWEHTQLFKRHNCNCLVPVSFRRSVSQRFGQKQRTLRSCWIKTPSWVVAHPWTKFQKFNLFSPKSQCKSNLSLWISFTRAKMNKKTLRNFSNASCFVPFSPWRCAGKKQKPRFWSKLTKWIFPSPSLNKTSLNRTLVSLGMVQGFGYAATKLSLKMKQ